MNFFRESGLPLTLELFFAPVETWEPVELEGGGATEEELLGVSTPIINNVISRN